MTTEAPAATLGEQLLEKLKASDQPKTLKEASKGVPKLKKEKAGELEARVRGALEPEVAAARVFVQPSGKAGAVRYWGRDERHLMRERALELATPPQPLGPFAKALAKETKADPAYVEGLLRDLIGDGLLHEHPGKKAPLFGSTPPPPPVPPLERPAMAKELAKLVVSVEKLMKQAGVDVASVLAAVRKQMTAEGPAARPVAAEPPAPVMVGAAIEQAILDAVNREGTMALNDLRRQMPEGGQGGAFDRAVLLLEERGRVSLSRDFDPTHFSPEERAGYVAEGESLYTSVAKRS